MVLPANKRFDSKLFAAMMRTARVSFASAEDMEKLIGLTPGEASVMGILNDPEGKIKRLLKNTAVFYYHHCKYCYSLYYYMGKA